MDKAMRVMWRMKRKAEQKQLNRDALALMRVDWFDERYRMLGAMAYRFVKGWIMANLVWVFVVGSFLLFWLILAPERLYAEFGSVTSTGFMQLSTGLKTLLTEFSYRDAVAIGALWMGMSSWIHYLKRIKQLRAADERFKSCSVNAAVFPSTAEEQQAWGRLQDVYAGEKGEKLAQAIRDNTNASVVFCGDSINTDTRNMNEEKQ
ncbi:hypothetical protein [Serratia odorifera]|uniref:Uncharacterized protein n=2 Tax=Serratia odorifera TaxID=618 RepID=D4EA51_SEROD|nr:hypothetical protein [Serratia odorifera]EFE93319.1 hypothetical protein HMPREF0758_5051 [Serratia odorifera DSM 4582]PNK88306.1 hypothetical protein CEQ31_000530 [Serratia odorifera]RII73960.1 hypothetical protein DX901_00955 [Serratia odorifera]VDZ51172.1 Uncharacterised protein [Serratia odorifera]